MAVVDRMSAHLADHRRNAIVLCTAVGLAWSLWAAQVLAQSGEQSSTAVPLDCKKLLESAQKLRSASIDMLATVREQRKQAEKMRDALGPDVADESIAFLVEQERQLQLTLREADAIRCPPASTPQSPDTPR
jgi:hypothetical protein